MSPNTPAYGTADGGSSSGQAEHGKAPPAATCTPQLVHTHGAVCMAPHKPAAPSCASVRVCCTHYDLLPSARTDRKGGGFPSHCTSSALLQRTPPFQGSSAHCHLRWHRAPLLQNQPCAPHSRAGAQPHQEAPAHGAFPGSWGAQTLLECCLYQKDSLWSQERLHASLQTLAVQHSSTPKQKALPAAGGPRQGCHPAAGQGQGTQGHGERLGQQGCTGDRLCTRPMGSPRVHQVTDPNRSEDIAIHKVLVTRSSPGATHQPPNLLGFAKGMG